VNQNNNLLANNDEQCDQCETVVMHDREHDHMVILEPSDRGEGKTE
jgi:hypothetical protein